MSYHVCYHVFINLYARLSLDRFVDRPRYMNSEWRGPWHLDKDMQDHEAFNWANPLVEIDDDDDDEATDGDDDDDSDDAPPPPAVEAEERRGTREAR